MTTIEAARLALDVQNACNLSGVLQSWARVQGCIISTCASKPSGEFRRHPIQVLFLSKIISLMTVGADCIGGVYEGGTSEGGKDLFCKAYAWCQDEASKEEIEGCTRCGQHGAGPCGCGFQSEVR
mgnify:FL=1